MNILVTGSNGQLGKEIQYLLNFFRGHHKWYFTTHNDLDITIEEAVSTFIVDKQIDVIINCAAYTNVEKAEDDKDTCYNINVNGVKNLAKAIKQTNGTLIHISTDYVFNGLKNTPYDETDVCSPTSVYGTTKREGELAIMREIDNYIIIRTSWLYSKFSHNNFVYKMLNRIKNGEYIKVVYDQVGCLTNAEDLAFAIIKIVNEGQLNKTGIYHFSNLGVCSWYDVVAYIENRLWYSTDILKKYCKVIPVLSSEFQTKAHRPNYSVFNHNKFTTTFNIEIPYWTDSLKYTLNYYNGKEKLS